MNEPLITYPESMISGQYGIKKELTAFLILVFILAVLLLGLLTGISADAKFLSQYFVWLYSINIIVGIGLLLVTIGLIITLTIRWRQGFFGTKLIAKLAMIFGLVGVLPGAILYSVSLQFVGRSIESWFDVNVESALESGLQLGRNSFEISQHEFLVVGNKLATNQQLTKIKSNQELKDLCPTIPTDQISIIDASSREFFSVNCGLQEIQETVMSQELLYELKKNNQVSSIEEVGSSPEAEAYQLNAFYLLTNQRILKITKKLDPTLVESAKIVQKAYRDYQEKSLSRLGLKKMYIGSLTLTMFLALFIAILLALILGRQLARPLLMLLRGTQAVAQGDLSPKPQMNTPDELGMLTRQFNNMTKQLSDARMSLQQSKDFSESVLANLTAGVCVLDASFRLVVANEGAKRILEKDLNQLIGKPLSYYPQLLYFETTIKDSFKTNQVSVGSDEQAPLDPNNLSTGERSWQRQIYLYDNSKDQDSVSPILLARGTELAGKQYIIVFDDITEVIAAQRSIAWGEVAQRLAHEIKNPLTPIQLSAERIYQKLTGKMTEEQEDIVAKGTTTIITQVQAMKTMVNNFRDFGKKPSPNMLPVNLNTLIQDILGLYEGTHIELKLDPAAPEILGDPTQLRQVIHNILQNSIDAATEIHSEPEIQIRTETVNYVGLVNQTEKLVRLSVADNGPGFSPRILSRAFEPYVTSKAKGTGLGLAVVKKIIDEHGARIELKNRMRETVIRGARISILFERLA
ncbi:PAS domain-containing sensor histidine kinase [Polynucleobacter sp. SHI8]|uniref:sensor histidine kinase n=1 Tax=unclassified Polynucleobacter TaxID=2640945 RepID=UPI002493286A|nr:MULTISPECIES: ATP-binding protein [unclassified Polynucleobacter]BDW12348.1 PAS domain-containing sensor histidine kinase [Polynucleobacter sp. SHI2]BDW14796.1 PAS domain-containing sensor histidine kinase [Polynucleobacter sp. SHI8]